MTIGLILCLIVALTVAGVLWNYQFLTIQSVEMECAARSAIQAAINDGTITNEDGDLDTTTLSTVLEAAYTHQNAGIPPTVTLIDPENRILKFEQKHRLGIFSGTLKKETQTAIENKSFIQYYQIIGSPGNYTFNKCVY